MSTYHSPQATFNPSPSIAAFAPKPTPLRLFTSPSKLSPDASEFIPPTHIPPTINSSFPTAPPILSPINNQQPYPQKYSPTIPSFYNHEISSLYPTGPKLYEAPDCGIPIHTQLSPYPEFQTPQSPTADYNYWATWYPSDLPNHHPEPPAPTPKPTPKKPSPPPKSKIPENIRNIVSQNVNGLTYTWKLEMIIDRMIENKNNAYLIQETWLTGNWEKVI